MGCDIHIVVERQWKGEWVASSIPHHSSPSINRNYDRFARLAGVRGPGPEPRGVPKDASQTTRYLVEELGRDGHSHSFYSLAEAMPIFLETGYEQGDFAKKYPEGFYFGIDHEARGSKPSEYRIVFWFDN